MCWWGRRGVLYSGRYGRRIHTHTHTPAGARGPCGKCNTGKALVGVLCEQACGNSGIYCEGDCDGDTCSTRSPTPAPTPAPTTIETSVCTVQGYFNTGWKERHILGSSIHMLHMTGDVTAGTPCCSGEAEFSEKFFSQTNSGQTEANDYVIRNAYEIGWENCYKTFGIHGCRWHPPGTYNSLVHAYVQNPTEMVNSIALTNSPTYTHHPYAPTLVDVMGGCGDLYICTATTPTYRADFAVEGPDVDVNNRCLWVQRIPGDRRRVSICYGPGNQNGQTMDTKCLQQRCADCKDDPACAFKPKEEYCPAWDAELGTSGAWKDDTPFKAAGDEGTVPVDCLAGNINPETGVAVPHPTYGTPGGRLPGCDDVTKPRYWSITEPDIEPIDGSWSILKKYLARLDRQDTSTFMQGSMSVGIGMPRLALGTKYYSYHIENDSDPLGHGWGMTCKNLDFEDTGSSGCTRGGGYTTIQARTFQF